MKYRGKYKKICLHSILETIFHQILICFRIKSQIIVLYEIELNYYLLEVGIIKFDDTEEPSNLLKSPSFPGLRIDELSTLIEFLVENSPRYLSGQVISLTGGRKFLDSTAAYEGVFGDLTVRKSSD